MPPRVPAAPAGAAGGLQSVATAAARKQGRTGYLPLAADCVACHNRGCKPGLAGPGCRDSTCGEVLVARSAGREDGQNEVMVTSTGMARCGRDRQ